MVTKVRLWSQGGGRLESTGKEGPHAQGVSNSSWQECLRPQGQKGIWGLGGRPAHPVHPATGFLAFIH